MNTDVSNVKLGINGVNNRGTVSSLSSSSSTSSNSSSSSSSSIPQINYEIIEPNLQRTPLNKQQQLLITPIKQGQFILSTATSSITPVKCDPKTLKLGGRPQSICSSSCSSPIPNIQSINNSPSGILNKSLDLKRSVTSSSPRYNFIMNSNNISNGIVSPSPSYVSASKIQDENSSYSSASIQKQNSSNAILLSSLSAKSATKILTKKENVKSVQLIPSPLAHNSTPQSGKNNYSLYANPKAQNFSAKLADSLNKFRMCNEIEEIDIVLGNKDDDEGDEEEEENENDDEEIAAEFLRKQRDAQSKKVSASFNTSNGNTQKSNEIWLEYGCI